MENNEKQAMVSFLIFKDNLFELVFHKVLCFGLVLHFNTFAAMDVLTHPSLKLFNNI